jgi:hypothetical protein
MALSTHQISEQGKVLVWSMSTAHKIELRSSGESECDFFAFSSRYQRNLKIKVTTNEKAKPAAGKGRLHLDWWVRDDTAADVIAFADLDSGRVWLVRTAELDKIAQQHCPKHSPTHFHFFMSIDPAQSPRRDGKKLHDYEFLDLLFERAASRIF